MSADFPIAARIWPGRRESFRSHDVNGIVSQHAQSIELLAIDGLRPGFDRIVYDHSQQPERRQRLFRGGLCREAWCCFVHLQVPVHTIASRARFNTSLSVGELGRQPTHGRMAMTRGLLVADVFDLYCDVVAGRHQAWCGGSSIEKLIPAAISRLKLPLAAV